MLSIYIPYFVLCFSTLLFWFSKNFLVKASGILLSLSIALFYGKIEVIGVIFILGLLTLGLILFHKKTRKDMKIFILFPFVAFCLALLGHQFPGFNNFKILDAVKFSHDSIPFTMYMNYDKPYVGLVLLLFYGCPLINNFKELFEMLKKISLVYIILVVCMLLSALALNYIRFDPKWPQEGLIWAINNLIIVCVAEEMFFRGFIQHNIEQFFSSRKYGAYIAIFISALLFGLAHFKGGYTYILLSTLAGLAYGYAYKSTRKIEGSIIVHFLLNLTHFTLFTYPALS